MISKENEIDKISQIKFRGVDMNYKSILGALLTILLISTATAQFSKANVEVEAQNLPRKARQDIRNLGQNIPQYFTDYEWFDNPYNINIPIRINLYASSVNTSGNDRRFTGQLFVATESGDQQFIEKKINFVYNTNQSLIHDETIRPLSSIFDFYGYVILAGIMDTYDIFGGEELYEKAQSIASRAQYSQYSAGWNDRMEKIENIMNLPEYRKFKYYFWKIIDLENRDKTEKISGVIDKMLKNLEEVYNINSTERNTTLFINARKRDIIGLLLDYGTELQRQKLIKIDSRNAKYYKKRIKEYKNK